MLMSNFLPRNPSPCFHSARHSHRLGFRLLITLQSPRPGGLLDEERETLLDIIPPFRQPDDPFPWQSRRELLDDELIGSFADRNKRRMQQRFALGRAPRRKRVCKKG